MKTYCPTFVDRIRYAYARTRQYMYEHNISFYGLRCLFRPWAEQQRLRLWLDQAFDKSWEKTCEMMAMSQERLQLVADVMELRCERSAALREQQRLQNLLALAEKRVSVLEGDIELWKEAHPHG